MKIPPHSLEAEKGVIGSVLLEPDKIHELELRPADFYDRRHNVLWEQLKEMSGSGKGMDVLTIGEYLKANGMMERSGGWDYLAELQDAALVPHHSQDYAKTVLDMALRRKMVDTGLGLAEAAYEGDTLEVGSKYSLQLTNALDGTHGGLNTRTTQDIAAESLSIDTKIANGERIGLPFPWINFQGKTFGIQKKGVTPLGGRDGKGKSRLSTFLTHFWVKQGIPVLYFPFEDSAQRFMSNMAATHGGYDMFTIKRHYVPHEFMPYHELCLSEVAKMPLYIEDMPCTAEDLAATIAKYKRKHGIEGVVIDGIKDIILTDGDNTTSKENHINAVLNRASKINDVAIMSISHINKVDDDRWISKGSITGSSNQSKSARMVLMYQDANFPGFIKEKYEDIEDCVVLDCQKANYGTRGYVVLKPELEYGRFVEVHPRDDENKHD